MAINRTLLQNGCVIVVDKALGNFRRADVLIEGTKIAAVGPDLRVTRGGQSVTRGSYAQGCKPA
jgi:dihydroorotase-like cyclic amidohydrolase